MQHRHLIALVKEGDVDGMKTALLVGRFLGGAVNGTRPTNRQTQRETQEGLGPSNNFEIAENKERSSDTRS
jgi:hypothetical protein